MQSLCFCQGLHSACASARARPYRTDARLSQGLGAGSLQMLSWVDAATHCT